MFFHYCPHSQRSSEISVTEFSQWWSCTDTICLQSWSHFCLLLQFSFWCSHCHIYSRTSGICSEEMLRAGRCPLSLYQTSLFHNIFMMSLVMHFVQRRLYLVSHFSPCFYFAQCFLLSSHFFGGLLNFSASKDRSVKHLVSILLPTATSPTPDFSPKAPFLYALLHRGSNSLTCMVCRYHIISTLQTITSLCSLQTLVTRVEKLSPFCDTDNMRALL